MQLHLYDRRHWKIGRALIPGEGLTFQAVKDQVRLEMALMRLETARVPISVLACELGFSDCATFQRAFKSWTGTTPGRYRARALDALTG